MTVKSNAGGLLRRAFRFEPDAPSLAAMLASIALVVGALSAATFIATPARGIAYFLLYAVLGAGICGVALPVCWTAFARNRPPSTLGITARRLPLSLGLQAACCIPLLPRLAGQLQGIDIADFLPLAALALAIGFFEAVFWRGWVYRTLEESFGIVPALVFGAGLYAAYHVGYGMPLSEMTFLFVVGLMFNAIFALTGSIFVLWPLFQPSGQLITIIKDGLSLPFMATIGFLEVLAAMIVIVIVAGKFPGKRAQPK